MLSGCKPVQVPCIHPNLGGGVREKGFNVKCRFYKRGIETDLLCMNQLRFASNIVKMVE